MNKNLLKSLFATAILTLTSVSTQAQCYLIGNDGNWQTNIAGAELQATETEGVYEGDVEFNEKGGWFCVTTKLTDEANDWDGLLPYRLGPDTPDKPLIYNIPNQLHHAGEYNGFSFQVADVGTHHVTVDLNNMTITMAGTYPERIFIMGSDGVWATDKASAVLDRVPDTDVYKANVDFVDKSYFAFFTTISDKPDDWEYVNANRWAYNGEIEPNNVVHAIDYDEPTSYIERGGSYEVTFNYTDRSYQLYDPTYNPDPIKYAYFVGNANNWQTSTCFAKLEESTTENVYTGEVELSDYFAIATKLTSNPDDWTSFNQHRWGPNEDGEMLSENTETDIMKSSNAFQIDVAGKYDVNIDLNTWKFYVNKLIASGIASAKTVDLTAPLPYYDLTGRNLGTAKPAKGMYIRGGKKIVVE